MLDEQFSEITHIPSDGGIAGPHPRPSAQVAFVAPATGKEFNTLLAGIVPIACWRVDNLRFAFDLSVVRPEVRKELESLAKLVKWNPPESKSDGNPGCPLSIFGHADPTGDDDYNKQLSGRRATAIYALLTRDTTLWEKFFRQPLGNDDWGPPALKLMLDFVFGQAEGVS